MPWKIIKHDGDAPKEGGPWCVHKENEDKSAGEAVACHATEAEAQAHLSALYANVPEGERTQGRPKVVLSRTTEGIERRALLTEDIALRVDAETGAPIVSGYASVFNSLSEVLFEWDLGRFREQIAPGAFAKTLREQNVPLLVEHADLPLATTGAHTLMLREDAHGLHYESTLEPADPDVQRLVPKMRRGDLNKSSFGFFPVRESWNDNTKPRTRTIHEARLYDVSIVARPAYPATEARVRKLLAADNLDAESIAELLVRLRLGLAPETDDLALMQTLTTTFRAYLPAVVTVAPSAPLPEHPPAATQPTALTASVPLPEHPLAWYRTQFDRVMLGG